METNEKVNFLQQVNLFQGLSSDVLQRIAQAFQVQKYTKKQNIFFETAPQTGLFLLVDTMVKLFKETPDGKTVIVKIIFPKEVFFILSCNKNTNIFYSASALVEGTALYIPESVLQKICLQFPHMTLRLLTETYNQLHYVYDMMRYTGVSTAEIKLAKLLLEFADKIGYKDSSGITFPLYLTRQEIADMLGGAAETPYRILKHFQELGILESTKKYITIKNREALEDYLI